MNFKIEVMVTGSISIRWLFQHLADVTWSKLTHTHIKNLTHQSQKYPIFIIFFVFFYISASILMFHLSLFGFFFLCKSHEGHCSEDEQKITRKNEKKIPKAISMTMLLFTNTKRHIQAQIYKHIHPKISLLSAYEMRFLRIISFHFHFGFLFILNRIVIVIVIVFSF